MSGSMAKTPDGDLRFYSIADMKKYGAMLDATALHAVAGEAWADISST